jgi:hypothetical protein
MLARDRLSPLHDPLGVCDADLEQAVVGTCVFEDLETRERTAHVAEENQGRRAFVETGAVHIDARFERIHTQVLRGRPDVRHAAEDVFHVLVGCADDIRVESEPGHHREPLAVHMTDVELPVLAGEADVDCLPDVVRDPEVLCEQIGGPGRHDREARLRLRQRIDAALHHPVAAPGEDQLRSAAQGALDLLGRLTALLDLVPLGVTNAPRGERLAELRQAPVEVLALVRDDCNSGHWYGSSLGS